MNSRIPQSESAHVFSRMKAFAYLTAERAALYRTIMRVFTESKEQFSVYLRPREILAAVRSHGLQADQADVDSAVEQLCEWGNLATHPDTGDMRTAEDFYKQRYLIQITEQGEAAERALALFQNASNQEGELRSAALADIRQLLQELKQLSLENQPDAARIHRNLLTLRHRFEDLASGAAAFMAGIQRKVDLQLTQTEGFTADTERLIDYLERFISELVIASEDIAAHIRDIETLGLERLLRAAAERSIVDAVKTTPEVPASILASIMDEWRHQWNHFKNWFISSPGCPSNAERLRRRARAAIPAMLSVLTSMRDRSAKRIDRSNDFRVLARSFTEAKSDAAAHRLWRTAFGLGPARHLTVNDATLDEHEVQAAPTDASWLEASPLRISPMLRTSGSYPRTGRLSRIVDRTAEKNRLASASRHEALRILNAQRRFAASGRMRLSDLDQLESGEFDLILDLLGEAGATNVFTQDNAESVSGNGRLRVKLEPTEDGRTAVIETSEGIFSGPDQWITIEQISPEEIIL